MNEWMIASALLALAGIGAWIAYALQRRELIRRRQRDEESERIRQEIHDLQGLNLDYRREINALYADMDDEQRYSGELEQELDDLYQALAQSQERAARAEARRTDAEKEIYASRMRAGQLEQQLSQAQQEQLAQEKLYQDIIRERDETIARLSEAQPRRKTKRKIEPLEHQIALDDLLNGGIQ